jgi:hypothetical protein
MTTPVTVNVTSDVSSHTHKALTPEVWRHSSAVVISATVVTSLVCLAGLVLNVVLVMTIHYSPSLKVNTLF